MAKRLDYWLTVSWLQTTYNLQAKVLNGRGVMTRVNADGHTEFNLHDAVDKCADLISKRLNTTDGDETKLFDAEKAKTSEELRKLQLSNALLSGEAVSVKDLNTETTNQLKAITENLARIPSDVKAATVDLPVQQVVAIRSAIIQKRNEAAEHKRTDNNG